MSAELSIRAQYFAGENLAMVPRDVNSGISYVSGHDFESLLRARSIDFYEPQALNPGPANFFTRVLAADTLWTKDGLYSERGFRVHNADKYPLSREILSNVEDSVNMGKYITVFYDGSLRIDEFLVRTRELMVKMRAETSFVALPGQVYEIGRDPCLYSVCQQGYMRFVYIPDESLGRADLRIDEIREAIGMRAEFQTNYRGLEVTLPASGYDTGIGFDEFLRLYHGIFNEEVNGTSLTAQSFTEDELNIAWTSDKVHFAFARSGQDLVGFFAGITDLNDSHLYNVVHTVNPAFMNELEMPYLYTLTFGLLPEVRDYRFFASGGITQMMIYIMESLNGERPLVFGGDIAYQYPNIEQGRGGNGGLQFVSRGLGVTSQASQKIVLHHNCMLI